MERLLCGTLNISWPVPTFTLFGFREIGFLHRRWYSDNLSRIYAGSICLMFSNFNYNDDDEFFFRPKEGGTPPPKQKGGSSYDRVFLGIAITITAVWAIGTIIQIAYPRHAVPQTVNYVMIAVAGAFFGGSLVTRSGSNGRGH